MIENRTIDGFRISVKGCKDKEAVMWACERDKQKEAVEAGAFLSRKSSKDAPAAFTASLLASRYECHVTIISLPEQARQKSLEQPLSSQC